MSPKGLIPNSVISGVPVFDVTQGLEAVIVRLEKEIERADAVAATET